MGKKHREAFPGLREHSRRWTAAHTLPRDAACTWHQMVIYCGLLFCFPHAYVIFPTRSEMARAWDRVLTLRLPSSVPMLSTLKSDS